MRTLEVISEDLELKLRDGSINTCRDFMDYCEILGIDWSDELFNTFYRTKRIFLAEKKRSKY